MINIRAFSISGFALTLAVATSPFPGNAQRIQSAAFAPSNTSSAYSTITAGPFAPRIWKHPSKNRRTHALKGATIGLVVGAVTLGTATYLSGLDCMGSDDGCFTPYWAALAAGAGAILGASTGAVIGAATWKPPNTTPK